MDLLKLTALELGEKIKAKEVTVREAVDAVIGQIKEAESEIHSFVTIDEEGAYAQAEEIQKKIDVGELTGPLAGVPVAIKDNMCIEGQLTTCSSKILSNFKPTYTAEAVENLRKAGAVIIGKTNMDEFAMGSTTETSYYGPTRYPSAKFILWCDRNQTNLWNRFPIWTYRIWIFFRSDWTGSERCIGLCGNS